MTTNYPARKIVVETPQKQNLLLNINQSMSGIRSQNILYFKTSYVNQISSIATSVESLQSKLETFQLGLNMRITITLNKTLLALQLADEIYCVHEKFLN